jgi:hypothetical protein
LQITSIVLALLLGGVQVSPLDMEGYKSAYGRTKNGAA